MHAPVRAGRGIAGAFFRGLVLVGALAEPALADRVTPSERVETRLRIREAADGESQVIGHLLPGSHFPWSPRPRAGSRSRCPAVSTGS